MDLTPPMREEMLREIWSGLQWRDVRKRRRGGKADTAKFGEPLWSSPNGRGLQRAKRSGGLQRGSERNWRRGDEVDIAKSGGPYWLPASDGDLQRAKYSSERRAAEASSETVMGRNGDCNSRATLAGSSSIEPGGNSDADESPQGEASGAAARAGLEKASSS